jgi:hypothetical protein
MPELFDPARHEALIDAPWDAGEARRAIERIVAEVRAEAGADGTWSVHPNDGKPEEPSLGLYVGGAGVALGLDHLVRIGAAAPGPMFADRLPGYLEATRRALRQFGAATRSYLMGDAGIRLAQWRAEPSAEIADELARVVAANADDPTLELMWGAPGTMLAALAMHRWTGELRWADLYRQSLAALDRAQAPDGPEGGVIWVQDLYGSQRTYLGAVHGFASIARALIVGRELIEPDVWAGWSARLARTLEVTAQHGEAGVNWAPAREENAPTKMLVQHCHGAPGMIFCFAELDAPIDALLRAAGELIWAAGPLTKGANFCHGTDGNGYAFLKLFRRTGDQLWLERARAFAMHAIAQSDAAARAFGRRRGTLWTGDVGLAAYLADCVDAATRFPSLEFET